MSFVIRKIRNIMKWDHKQLGTLWVCALLTVAPLSVLAHKGEIKVKENGTPGAVKLTKAQQQTIDLKVTPASQRLMRQELNLNGEVQLMPDRQANVSIRISGHITAVYANLGDKVRKGQALAKIQSRLVGEPPPSVVIKAPLAGVIDARNVNLGQTVEPNSVLFHISDRTKMLIIASVYEEDVGKVKLNQEAVVQVLSYPDRVFMGKVILVSPNLDTVTRTVKVWIEVANLGDLLKPNMFAKANLLLQKKEDALSVPNAAVLEAKGQKFVFVREGNQFSRVLVKTGVVDQDYTEIREGGLVPGDEVVTQGTRQLYTLWLTGDQTQKEDH